MPQRLLTALLIAPLVVLLILFAPTWLFALAIAGIFLSGLWEWSRLAGMRNHPRRALLLAVAAALFAVLWIERGTPLWPVLIAAGALWWLIACCWLYRFAFAAAPTPENRNLKLVAGALAIVPAWMAAVAVHGSSPHGHGWTFLALAVVWAADSGAYYSGRRFGRRKLAPAISPGKTWAGVYGAFVAGAVVMLAGGWLLGVRDIRLAGLLLVAVCTVAASIVGDLFESLLKRHAQVKDSGTLFPGHGGMLDRLDSIFAAMPVFALGKWLLSL